jgi:outer membrane protein TolC
MKLLALALALAAGAAHAEPLSLPDYLEQVRHNNPQMRALKAQDVAYALAAKQPLTAYSPMLNGQIETLNDQTVPVLAAFSPAQTNSDSWNLGVSKFFSTGTNVNLAYEGDVTKLTFPPGGFVSDLPATTGHQWDVTVSQSLWRNFNAAEVKASIAQASAGSEAARAANRYAAQALLFQARTAYVQLETARQVRSLQEESLTRNAKILDWTQQKEADNLADKVDVLQVQASMRLVSLGLSSSRQAEAEGSALFNRLRGVSATADVEELEPLSMPAGLPAPKGDRADIEAARQALKGSDAQVESIKQSFTPDVSVFATLGMNDRDTDGGTAFNGSWSGSHPQSIIGLKVSANLDRGLMLDVLSGAKQATGAGQAQVDDKEAGLASDWQQLQKQWDGTQDRLALAQELEKLQGEKADREKVRYQDGRTTNFQVLRFEDDYALARIQILQLLAGARAIEAQARFYNGDDQAW